VTADAPALAPPALPTPRAQQQAEARARAPQPWSAPNGYSPAIYADLFPATVSFPTGTRYLKTRTILTAPPSPRLFVFVDSPRGPAAQIVAEYDPDQLYGALNQGFDVLITLPHPALLSIRPEGGCGCGSRLRTLRPFHGPRQTTLPSSLPPLPAPQYLFSSLSPDPTAPSTSPDPTSPPPADAILP
jgi:hypothetical protein